MDYRDGGGGGADQTEEENGQRRGVAVAGFLLSSGVHLQLRR